MSLVEKLQLVVKHLVNVMPQSDRALFVQWMNEYINMVKNGANEWPEPNTGNVKMDKLIVIILESLENEQPLNANDQKRVGYRYYPYWRTVYWWPYWYNYWSPYYWWPYSYYGYGGYTYV